MATTKKSGSATKATAKKAASAPAKKPQSAGAARKTMANKLGSLATSLRENESTLRVVALPIEQIKPDPAQARRTMDKGKLDSLTASVKAQGVQVPIRVYPSGDNEKPYIIRYGERRWRAAQMAGLSTIPAMIGEADETSDRNRLTEQVTENLQREDMVLVDTVMAVCQIASAEGNQATATALGMPKSWVSKMVTIGNAGGVVAEMLEREVTKDIEALYLLASVQKKDAGRAKTVVDKIVRDGGERARATVKAAYDALTGKVPPAAAKTGAEGAGAGEAPGATTEAEAAGTGGATDGEAPASETPGVMTTTAAEADAPADAPAPDPAAAGAPDASPPAARTGGTSEKPGPQQAKGAKRADSEDAGDAMPVRMVEFTAGGSVIVYSGEQRFHFDSSLLEKLGVE